MATGESQSSQNKLIVRLNDIKAKIFKEITGLEVGKENSKKQELLKKADELIQKANELKHEAGKI